MTVFNRMQSGPTNRLLLGIQAVGAVCPSALPETPETTSPGTLFHEDKLARLVLQFQPSGCDHALEYWRNFTPFLSFEGAAAPSAWCGSGSDGFQKTFFEVKKAGAGQESDPVASLSHIETIAGIRSALSLQIKELAEILRVQRPTIYSWINDEAKPSAANRKRLQQVFRIASQWNRRCNLPIEELVRVAGTNGYSILDLLKDETINEDGIISRFDDLAIERKKVKAEADSKRTTVGEIVRRHGLNPGDVSDQQHLIDAETGKRSHPD